MGQYGRPSQQQLGFLLDTVYTVQTLAVDVCIVPGRVIQTQDGFRCLIVSVFEADVTSNDNQRVVDCLVSTQRSMQRHRQLRTVHN